MLKHKKFETTRERDTELQEVVAGCFCWHVEINSTIDLEEESSSRGKPIRNVRNVGVPAELWMFFFAANPS